MYIEIAKFLAGHESRDSGLLDRMFEHIRNFSTVNKRMRQTITRSSMRPAVARILSIALPHMVSTGMILTYMGQDRELEARARLETGASKEASAALLSRLVDLSKAAKGARAAARADPNLIDLITRRIESARHALLESLQATVVAWGTEGMYGDPDWAKKCADDAIESLKRRPYLPITSIELLNTLIPRFMSAFGREDILEKYGPLCLWDVSSVTDFTGACSVLNGEAGFSSDLFWNTGSATVMSKMFEYNEAFKGYIGTWDVSKVTKMDFMFNKSGIEDSGIASWNTTSLTDARFMFSQAAHLSPRLDLSKWRFGDSPDKTSMFAVPSIVDSGFGQWDVTQTKWPGDKVERANPPERKTAPVGFGTSAKRTTDGPPALANHGARRAEGRQALRQGVFDPLKQL